MIPEIVVARNKIDSRLELQLTARMASDHDSDTNPAVSL
jgi:hypothetical protein